MNGVLLAIASITLYLLAYKFYGKFLRAKVFILDPERETPAQKFKDDLDYVPTNRHILFGHHFTSIAGAAPIIGPAIAVIWGWLPALLWVVFGTIFLGAVHDFGSLVVSLRHEGRSIGDLTKELVGERARTLFMFILFFLLTLVIAVFAIVIAKLFVKFPATVIPIWAEIPIAILLALLIYKTRMGLVKLSIVAVILMYVTIYIGAKCPLHLPVSDPNTTWILLILVYAFVASILPVWLLLQPRDYINSHELIIVLGMMFLGIGIVRPAVVAPLVQLQPLGAPPLYPLLFVTIACGAISGFHALVSSGTTVKQLDSEKNAYFIGYGGMIAEGILATAAIIACTAGFASAADWRAHYANWGSAEKGPLAAFISGGGGFIEALGISKDFALAIVGVLLVSFAMTTIDTATRLQRYIIGEIGRSYKIKGLQNRYLGASLAIIVAGALALWKYGQKEAGLIIWPIFGTTNQILAALTLLTVTIYLVKKKRPSYCTFVPMVFMMMTTILAMLYNIRNFIRTNNWLLTIIGTIILALAVWLVFEAWLAYRGFKRKNA